jgi:hypothetical protein
MLSGMASVTSTRWSGTPGRLGFASRWSGASSTRRTGNLTSTVEVASEKEYSTVLVDSKLVDAQGTVVA